MSAFMGQIVFATGLLGVWALMIHLGHPRHRIALVVGTGWIVFMGLALLAGYQAVQDSVATIEPGP